MPLILRTLKKGNRANARSRTVKPLADRLRLTPITRWGHGDEGKIVADINGFTGVVLVRWRHKAIIANLLPALLAGQLVPDLPLKWDGERSRLRLRCLS